MHCLKKREEKKLGLDKERERGGGMAERGSCVRIGVSVWLVMKDA